MAAATATKKNVTCMSCGFKNNPDGSKRCASCGSKLEELAKTRVTDNAEDRRYQQEGLNLSWLGIAIAVQAVLTAAVIFGIPMLMPSVVDFEGGSGMVTCIPIWFLGGVLIGLTSPGRTFMEPVIGSFIVAMPTTYLLVQNQTVRTMPTFLYVVMAAIGVLFTLIGAYTGERVQLGPAPEKTE
jgi:DNA-directed RNA polymerase subunit RPC12/RpoP